MIFKITMILALFSLEQSFAGVINYSIDTTDAPIWDRPYTTGDGTSGSCTISNTFGIGVHYIIQEIIVDTTGVYTISSDNLAGGDNYLGYMHLYRDSFNSVDQCLNLLSLNDTGNVSQIVDIELIAGKTYIVVHSGWDANQFGHSNVTISGVGQPSLPINLISDSSFEEYNYNSSAWAATSITFGTPICSDSCGTDFMGQHGSHTGRYWAYLGGTASFEETHVSQAVMIPSTGFDYLNFYLAMPSCGNTQAYMELLLNNTQAFSVNHLNTNCGMHEYKKIKINISAYKNQLLNIEFHSLHPVPSNGFNITNFFIDDVEITNNNEYIFENGFE